MICQQAVLCATSRSRQIIFVNRELHVLAAEEGEDHLVNRQFCVCYLQKRKKMRMRRMGRVHVHL